MHKDEIKRLKGRIQANMDEIIALGLEVHRLESERDEDFAKTIGYSSAKELIDHLAKRPKRLHGVPRCAPPAPDETEAVVK